jgi:hypothetical protein
MNYGPEDRGRCCKSWIGIRVALSRANCPYGRDPAFVARQKHRRTLRAEARCQELDPANTTRDLTRFPRGRGEAGRQTLLLNIDEILIGRADAYRLHRREKEASNCLGR